MLHSTSPDGLDVPFGSNCIVSYCDFQAFQKYDFKISSTCTFIYNFQGFPECSFVIFILICSYFISGFSAVNNNYVYIFYNITSRCI